MDRMTIDQALEAENLRLHEQVALMQGRERAALDRIGELEAQADA